MGSFNSPAQRCRQLQRVLTLISLVSPLRYGATTDELYRDMLDQHGDICRRTIVRDLETLELLGFVRRESKRFSGCKWLWIRQQRTEQLVSLAEHWPRSADKPPETTQLITA